MIAIAVTINNLMQGDTLPNEPMQPALVPLPGHLRYMISLSTIDSTEQRKLLGITIHKTYLHSDLCTRPC